MRNERDAALVDDAQTLDRDNMLEKLVGFADQLEQAHERAATLRLPAVDHVPRAVVVSGMGGSAIGADMLCAFLADDLPAPMLVSRDATLPGFLTPEDLCVVCSYSGNTAEALQALSAAIRKGIPVVVCTTGGKLQQMADAAGVPCAAMAGGLMPRAALPTLFMTLWHVLSQWRLCRVYDDQVRTTLDHLRQDVIPRFRDPGPDNPARRLAGQLHGTLPLIYSTAAHLHPVALRWKNQINENAKQLAYVQVFPELIHNEVMGWERDDALLRQCRVVLLQDTGDAGAPPPMVTAMRDVLFAKTGTVETVEASGGCRMARIFSLILLGDFVSFYLAQQNHVDPTPIQTITDMKAKMTP